MEPTAIAISCRRPLVLADLVPGERVRDVALVLAAAAFVGALAQVAITLPFTPVPITGQTFGVLLAGCALGWHRALVSGVVYVGLGFLGLPWFVHHTDGWQGSSTGYLLGFVLASAVCGRLAERGADRKVIWSVATMLVGEVCIYVFGVSWLAIDLHIALSKALALGFTPFVVGDALKLACAAGLLPGAWWLTGEGRRVR